jgi:deoxyribose-phosphate aldolase
MALRTDELSKTIDQTALDAGSESGDVEAVCRRARDVHVASVCVLPAHVERAAEELRGSDVKVCAVIGFPYGEAGGPAKIAEAELALAGGAGELEFVMNARALAARDVRLFRDELVTFVRKMRMKSANGGRGVVVLKAVLGTAILDDKLKRLACKILEQAEVDFAQTSPGHDEPATIRDVELLRDCLSESVGVKASGGIESLEDVRAMINAGATRIGSSSAVEFLAGPALARA